jgi:high-affinity Fe2+/Pb2+ permease
VYKFLVVIRITKNLSWVKGLIFGAIVSFISALFFMLFGQAWAGGITSFWSESWLYFAVIILFAIPFAVLGGYFHKQKEVSNKNFG